MLSMLIAEVTECDFKQSVEIRKPKSWLKSVSAFANTAGGTLFFGVDDNHVVTGLEDPQKDAGYKPAHKRKDLPCTTIHTHSGD